MTDSEEKIRGALKAPPTAGPWFPQVFADAETKDKIASFINPKINKEDYKCAEFDAIYIAACNPKAISELLAELDLLRSVSLPMIQKQ